MCVNHVCESHMCQTCVITCVHHMLVTSQGWNVVARVPCDNIYCLAREFKSVVARSCVYGGFIRVFGRGVKTCVSREFVCVCREFVCDVTREFCNAVRVFVKLPLETPVRNSR